MTFTPPTLDEIKLAAGKSGLPEFEAEKFWNFYESIGWKVGKNPMVSWAHALCGWRLRWQEREKRLSKRKEEVSASVQMIRDQKELERVEAGIEAIRRRNQTDPNVEIPWPRRDKEEIQRLKILRGDLMKRLGMSV